MRQFPKTNTSYDYVNDFINTVAPVICEEYLQRVVKGDKTIFPSVVIAQACLESGYNLEAQTLFGIKGDGVNLTTQEFINGAYITIQDSFEYYPNIGEAVKGYYELMQWDNYDDATYGTTPQEQVYGLTNDIGYKYATSPTYFTSIMNLINDYELTKYDEYMSGEIRKYLDEEIEIEINQDKVLVKPGDSFWGIARDYLADGNRYKELAEFNGFNPDDILPVGTLLSLPSIKKDPVVEVPQEVPPTNEIIEEPDFVVTVQDGDSLWKIVTETLGDATRLHDIADYNHLNINNPIYVGMEIRIPKEMF